MAEPTAVRAPVENVNDDTVAIVRWLVDNGSFVEQGTSLLMAETTKASFDVESPVSGFLWQTAVAGSDVPIGEILCYVGEDLEGVKAAAAVVRPEAHRNGSGPQSRVDETPARFSGKASALVQKLGFDPALFNGRGLVQEKDVLAYRDSLAAKERPATATETQPTVEARLPVSPAAGVDTRTEPLERSKRYEGRRLRAAFSNTIPSAVTMTVPTFKRSSSQADATDPAGLRSAALIAETARLLRAYPVFNSYYANDSIHYYEQINIGYAIDLGHGLKVPVLRAADRKSITEIADEKQRLLLEYLDNALSVEALAGGTFTITDLSGEGVSHFHPVINDGQAAILGVCAETFAPGSSSGAFNLVLAFDHQLTDGRTAAGFLRDLRERLIAHETGARAHTAEAAIEPSCSLCLRPVSELEESRHFLVRTVPGAKGAEQTVCTICLQDWYA